MFRRGQATVFILLAVVLVLIVVSQVIVQQEPQRAEGFEETAQGVQNFVQGCLEQVTDEALITVAHQGGLLFSTLAPSIDYAGKKVPVMSYQNEGGLINKELVASTQLTPYILAAMDDCVDDFNLFPGMDITAVPFNSDVIIGEDTVSVDLTYPITIKTEGIEKTFDKFTHTVPARLGPLIDGANAILIQTLNSPDTFNIGTMSTLDFDIDVVTDEGYYVYILADTKYPVANNPYVFMFASAYEVDNA